MNRFGLFFVMLLAFLCLTLFNEGIIKILAKLLVEFKKIVTFVSQFSTG